MDDIPDDLIQGASNIVLGFAADLTNADAMIELIARFALAERERAHLEPDFINGLIILLCHRLLRNAIFPKKINRLATCAQKY